MTLPVFTSFFNALAGLSRWSGYDFLVLYRLGPTDRQFARYLLDCAHPGAQASQNHIAPGTALVPTKEKRAAESTTARVIVSRTF